MSRAGAGKPEEASKPLATGANQEGLPKRALLISTKEQDMTLRAQGFRFIKRGADFKWIHPAEVQPSDVDCSDMSDDDFAAFVAAVE